MKKRRSSRRLRGNTLVPRTKRKPPKLRRGNVYVYMAFAEAPLETTPEFRAALKDVRSQLRFLDVDDAIAVARDLDRDYPGLRWHVTDAQVDAQMFRAARGSGR